MKLTKEEINQMIKEEISKLNLKEDEFSDAAKKTRELAIDSSEEIAKLAKPLVMKIVSNVESAVKKINAKEPTKYPEDQVRLTIKNTLAGILDSL